MNQAIKNILAEKKLKLTEVHRRIVQAFGKQAIAYRSLQRIIASQTQPSTTSLYQLCIGLGVSPNRLQLDDEQSKSQITGSEKTPRGLYLYDPNACAAILTDKRSPFACLKLILKPRARIEKKAKLQRSGNAYRFIFVMRGKVKCRVNDKEFILGKGETLELGPGKPLFLENMSAKATTCFIVQHPNNL